MAFKQGAKACVEIGVLVEGDVVLGLWAGDHKGARASAGCLLFCCGLAIPACWCYDGGNETRDKRALLTWPCI